MSQTITIKYKRTAYSDTDLLEGLKQQQEWAVCAIYKTQFNAIKKMVSAFRNTRLDVEDVFQEGLARVILNIRAGRFKGNCAFATYLNSICYNICLKELNRKKEQLLEQFPAYGEEDNSADHFELLNSVLELRKNLPEKCRAIIDLRFRTGIEPSAKAMKEQDLNSLIPFELIARTLGISADNARQRFVRCIRQLKELVFSDPEIKEHFELQTIAAWI